MSTLINPIQAAYDHATPPFSNKLPFGHQEMVELAKQNGIDLLPLKLNVIASGMAFQTKIDNTLLVYGVPCQDRFFFQVIKNHRLKEGVASKIMATVLWEGYLMSSLFKELKTFILAELDTQPVLG